MVKVLVVRSEEGRIVSSEVVEKNLEEVAKDVARRALEEWSPGSSDFTVLRAKYEIRYKIPLSNPDIVDIVRELGLEAMREGQEFFVVQVPVYTISFDNAWMGDAYHDKKMYIVALYLDEESKRQIEEYAVEATREPKKLSPEPQLAIGEAELKALEEGLRELEEEEEKPRKRSRRRKKKSKS